jgi:hypothetical protein
MLDGDFSGVNIVLYFSSYIVFSYSRRQSLKFINSYKPPKFIANDTLVLTWHFWNVKNR